VNVDGIQAELVPFDDAVNAAIAGARTAFLSLDDLRHLIEALPRGLVLPQEEKPASIAAGRLVLS
jgi:hypothetical protein